MEKIISIINNKGGVGKTTTAGIMVQLLAYLGKRVLAIDLDPQSNLSMMLGCYIREDDDVIRGIKAPITQNIYDVFKYRLREKSEIEKVIVNTNISNLHIIPSNNKHKNTAREVLANQTGNNNIILKKAIDSIKDDYDYIIIDNAPANDILTVNSLFVSDLVYVPVRLEEFSYEGLKETITSILYIKEEHNISSIEFGGAFITQAEVNTKSYKETRDKYEKELADKFMSTAIRKDIRVSDIEKEYRPVLEYCPNTNAVFDYAKLILEMGILDNKARALLENSTSE